jgi:hypothetical protein
VNLTLQAESAMGIWSLVQTLAAVVTVRQSLPSGC